MSPEKQRIAIAEACGLEVLPAAGIAKAMVRAPLCTGAASTDWRVMPDYLNDLNAMAEVEKHMRNTMGLHFSRDYYENTLPSAVSGCEGCWDVVSATAAQRAEAFLRTLSLWKD